MTVLNLVLVAILLVFALGVAFRRIDWMAGLAAALIIVIIWALVAGRLHP